ncbi:MAG: 4Fe-4S dicluster domain-containing protein [bacterium]|nr:4Fe-4S dicluster domain-containing protein [bacterium]
MAENGKRSGSTVSTKSGQTSRRTFLRSVTLAGGLIGASLMGFIPVIKGWVKRLRPPGALVETDFLASCIKCGQCVQVCPVEAIHIADLDDGIGVGTPYIDPRAQACDFSCDGLQCVLACPTGALTHHIDYPHQAEMAMAKIVNPTLCLASRGEGVHGSARGRDFKGKLRYTEIDRWNPISVTEHPYDLDVCDLCVRQCPIEQRMTQCDEGNPPANDPNQCPPEHAIRLVETGESDGRKTFTPEILSGCVGCGVCQMICPAESSVFEMDVSTQGAVLGSRRGGHS